MTNTIDRKSARAPKSNAARKARVGACSKHKRTATDIGLALITPLVGQEFLDRYNLRDPLNRGLNYGVKTGLLRRRRDDPRSSSRCPAPGKRPNPAEGQRRRTISTSPPTTTRR